MGTDDSSSLGGGAGRPPLPPPPDRTRALVHIAAPTEAGRQGYRLGSPAGA
jgi:hypothetical protein